MYNFAKCLTICSEIGWTLAYYVTEIYEASGISFHTANHLQNTPFSK